MKYWYAMQGDNFKVAIEQNALWTCPRGENMPLKETRSIIFEMRPGDVVFHHAKGCLRAVSRVTASHVEFQRPPGYKRRKGEGDLGWLVKLDPIKTGLSLPYRRLHEFIKPGRPGPLNTKTSVYLGFLSRLTEADGLSLLKALEIQLRGHEDGLLGRSPDYWNAEETDAKAWRSIRKEQGHLRDHLLKGRLSASCSLCGEELPSTLLVAGHIKPRSQCSEQERWDFGSAAMLVCSLGCDALFEWGYVTVGADGQILSGARVETRALSDAVARLLGRRCSAHHEHTAKNFAEHRRIKLDDTSGRRIPG